MQPDDKTKRLQKAINQIIFHQIDQTEASCLKALVLFRPGNVKPHLRPSPTLKPLILQNLNLIFRLSRLDYQSQHNIASRTSTQYSSNKKRSNSNGSPSFSIAMH